MDINLEREEMALLEAVNTEKNCMLYRPSYNSYIQSTTATILLCQILYWAKKRDFQPFYKTNESWCHDLKISIQELRTAKNRLVHLGLIEIIVKGIPAKSFYKVCVQNVMKMLECIEEETSQDSPLYGYNQFVDSNKQECDIQQTKMLLATQQSVSTNTTVCWKPPTTTETTHKIKQKTTKERLSSAPSKPLLSPPASLQEKSSKSKQPNASKQGNRIDPSLPLSPERIEIATKQGLHESWVSSEFERFIDYYANPNLSRSKALHVDWDAAWRNWCKKAILFDKFDKLTKERPHSQSTLIASKNKPQVSLEFEPLLKACNWVNTSLLSMSWLEREGEKLFVNSDLSFVSGKLESQFGHYFEAAYNTKNIIFRHKPKGDSVCNQN